MTYFYARVSTKEQNLDRQRAEADKYGYDAFVYDEQSGKNFDRPKYQKMKEATKPGDILMVKELDRLGRNKGLVKKEIEYYKEKGVILRILDMPTTMIDYGDQAWIGDMITNILIEVLASIAEQERNKILKRQAEGIAAMPIVDGKRVSNRNGKSFGRVPKPLPKFEEYYELVKAGKMQVTKAIKLLEIHPSQWYRMCERKERAKCEA